MKKNIKTLVLSLISLSFLIFCGSTNIEKTNITPTGDFLVDSVNYTKSLSNPNNKLYYDEGAKNIYERNTEANEKLIAKWEKESPRDADLFVIKFNNEYAKAISTTVQQSAEKPTDRSFVTRKGENDEPLYVFEVTTKDSKGLKRCCDILEEALIYHPVRLDIWFGLIKTYLDAGLWNKSLDALNRCLEVLDKTDNRWLWTTNATIFHKDGDRSGNDLDFIISSYDYVKYLNSVGTKETNKVAESMKESLFEHFPNNVVLLNLVSRDYINNGQVKEGKTLLLKAHKIEPSDLIIIGNLALVSCLENNEEEFNKYYEVILNSGDEALIKQIANLHDSIKGANK